MFGRRHPSFSHAVAALLGSLTLGSVACGSSGFELPAGGDPSTADDRDTGPDAPFDAAGGANAFDDAADASGDSIAPGDGATGDTGAGRLDAAAVETGAGRDAMAVDTGGGQVDATPGGDAADPRDAQEGGADCQPGITEERQCGRCGVQTRVCTPSGRFGTWGGCASEGACAPGDREARAGALTCATQQIAIRSCTAQCTWGSFACECDPSTSFCGATVLVFDPGGLGLARRAVAQQGGSADVVTTRGELLAKLGASPKPRALLLEADEESFDLDSLRALEKWIAGGGPTIYRGALGYEDLQAVFAVTVKELARTRLSLCTRESLSFEFGSIARSGTGPDLFSSPREVTGLRLEWAESCLTGGRRTYAVRSTALSVGAGGEVVGAATRSGKPWPVVALTRGRKVFVHGWTLPASDHPPDSVKNAYIDLLVNELAFFLKS